MATVERTIPVRVRTRFADGRAFRTVILTGPNGKDRPGREVEVTEAGPERGLMMVMYRVTVREEG